MAESRRKIAAPVRQALDGMHIPLHEKWLANIDGVPSEVEWLIIGRENDIVEFVREGRRNYQSVRGFLANHHRPNVN